MITNTQSEARTHTVSGEGEPPLPDTVRQLLRRVARRQLFAHLAECLAFCIGLACLFALGQCLADWFFNLPWSVRLLLLLGDLAILGYIVQRFGWSRWTHRLDARRAALLVESQNPAFRSGLISIVDFHRDPRAADSALVRALSQQVTGLAHDPGILARTINTGHAKRWLRRAGLLLGLTLAAAFLTSPKSKVLVARLLLSTQPLPTDTLVLAGTTDLIVPLGAEVPLAALASGVRPSSGRLELTYADGDTQVLALRPSAESPETFRTTLSNVQQSFTYRFFLNDGAGETFSVTVLPSPVLESLDAVQRYPAYTGKTPEAMETGNYTFLAGSMIELEGRATQALQSASLVLWGAAETVIPMKVEGDRLGLNFPVPKEGVNGLSIRLISADGIASQEETRYNVQFIDDLAPAVELRFPESAELSILPSVQPRLAYTVQDDFGLSRVELHYEIVRPNGQEESAHLALPLPESARSGAVQQVTWDLTRIDPPLRPDTWLSYWIEAMDNNDVTGPGVGQSAKKTIRIVSREAKNQELIEQLKTIASELERVYDFQSEVNQTLDESIQQIVE